MSTTCRRCKEVYGRWRPRCPVCGLSEAHNAIANARAAGEREKARRETRAQKIPFTQTSVEPKPRPRVTVVPPLEATRQLDPTVPLMSLGDALKKVL